MREIVLIFPHQLFINHPGFVFSNDVVMAEELLFFKQYRFHKHKLILHRASMKAYENHLRQNHFQTAYVESHEDLADVRKLIPYLQKQKVKKIHIAEPADDWLSKRIHKSCTACGITLVVHDAPGFLNSKSDGAAYLKDRKKYFQTDFYISQRKSRKILLNSEGKPLGDKWSFDADNRKRYPKNKKPPEILYSDTSGFLEEAVLYVNKQYPDNPGSDSGPFYFATDVVQAEKCLDNFLQNRFREFGDFEDAIVANESVLHHSVLSPMINVGLLEPAMVLEKTLAFAKAHDIPLNTTEGFIRQIIGWREFVRMVYDNAGGRQRRTHFWKFKRKIPDSFYNGSTGIAPVDITINKILKTGYCHHIERLMVLGNFMLLCEFDPDEVYRWFMEMFIDAYDWVMVPNVYGMTQFADGGLMTTKPYISGSNYLMKMSDYEKGEWQQIWDALFWRFMHVQRDFFTQNPRLGMLVRTFDKMSDDKRNGHLSVAEKFLQSL